MTILVFIIPVVIPIVPSAVGVLMLVQRCRLVFWERDRILRQC